MGLKQCITAGLLQLLLIACIVHGSDVIDSESASEDLSRSGSYLAVIVSVSALVSIVLALAGCAICCPRRRSDAAYTVRQSDNPDVFFNDVTIGRPPVVNFPMYPPVESAQGVTSTPIYFEPLPDVAAKAEKMRQQQQQQANAAPNAARLRPKIWIVNRDSADSGSETDGDMETSHWCDVAYEQAKLERMLSAIQRANARHQFPRSQLQYIRELGTGWFGKVLQGEGSGILPGYKKTKVVIQMLKDDSDSHDQFIFLQEASAYRVVDSPNVLKLLGQCVETSPYLTILELCSLGDLKTYLLGERSNVEWLDSQGLLLNFGCDMAAGLQALHQNSFVHRDFAIRNCLVSADMTIKVGDYGLAEELFKDDYMYDASGNAIPIRWLAPESVQLGRDVAVSLRVITKECNLWSFGVALWEVFTCGGLPYPGISDESVIRHVIAGGSVRLSQPELPVPNIDRLYKLMQMCWQSSPGNRASLRELRIMLLHLHSASRGDPDTASFDLKWNQLMPRQLLPTAEDSSSAAGNASSSHSPTVDVVDVDLGTASVHAAHMLPSHLPPPVASSVPSLDNNPAKSPVNELSLAAELGALERRCADDDTNLRLLSETADNSRGTAHFSVLAKVHNEKLCTPQRDPMCRDEEKCTVSPLNTLAAFDDSSNVPLSESVDITEPLSSPTDNPAAMMQVQKYASYLKTVNTSVTEGDEDVVSDINGRLVLHKADDDIGESTCELDQFYQSLAADASVVSASEEFLGDSTAFAQYYREQAASDDKDSNSGL